MILLHVLLVEWQLMLDIIAYIDAGLPVMLDIIAGLNARRGDGLFRHDAQGPCDLEPWH